MTKVLITGGTGFIGSRLARACSDNGDEVRILALANTDAESQNLAKLKEERFDVVEGSVVDVNSVVESVQGIDIVYHLAAAQHEAGRSNRHFFEVNVDGTRNMLEAAAAAGISRFVHGSTIGVYQGSHGIVEDDSPTVPDNIYGVTKLEGERVVASFQRQLPTVVIRISETYGPGDRRLLKLFKGVRNKRYIHIGRSNNLHHPVYVDDLVRGLRLASEKEAACGQTMVLPGYDVVTSREMVTAIANAVDVRAPRLTIPLWPLWTTATVMEWTLRPLGISPPLHRRRMHFFVKSFKFSGARARALLDYRPQVSFAEGAARTASWYREMNLL